MMKKDPIREVLKIFTKGYNKQVILYGPPGTSKTYSSTIIASNLLQGKNDTNFEADYDKAKNYLEGEGKDFFQLVQFHPSYNYDDFVRGIKMEIDKESHQPKYETVNKIFGAIADTAYNNPNQKYVLVIDEINRAPLASVLGELIYGLEYRDRSISTPYKLTVGDNDKIVVPNNLYIIGTMNTADRSIGSIDYAVRRRFAFISLPSDIDVALETWNAVSKINKDIDILKLKESIKRLYEDIKHIKLASDVSEEDIMLGHSYFMYNQEMCSQKDANNVPQIDNDMIDSYMEYRIEYQMKPILREYMSDGLIERSEENSIEELTWDKFKY